MKEEQEIKCSFCGTPKHQTQVLIAGATGHICDNCVTQAENVVKQELSAKTNKALANDLTLYKPAAIKK